MYGIERTRHSDFYIVNPLPQLQRTYQVGSSCTMNRVPSPYTSANQESLRDQLLVTVDLLDRRRAAEIGAGYIEDYVALNWLEWNGGTLRLTTAGENVRRQMALKLGGTCLRKG